MGKTIMGAVVSLDGFMADDDDGVGPFFDWLGNGDVTVTHRPPIDWEYADTAPFTFVDGVEKAIAAAQEFAGDRVVDVAAPLLLENAVTIVQGDRVTHLLYDVTR